MDDNNPRHARGQRDADAWDIEVAESAHPRIVDGDFEAVFVRHETALLFKTGKVFLWFRIVAPGPHFGVEICRPYRCREIIGRPGKGGRFKLNRGSDLFKDLARLLDVARRPDRISLHDLRGPVWVIRTRTVDHDHRQRPIPEAARYSVVSEILHAAVGAVSSSS